MTKAELIDAIKAELGDAATKATIQKVLQAAGSVCRQALAKGESFSSLGGLGSFKVVERPARQGRNPRTGEKMTIPARKVVKFTASKTTKDAL